MTGQGLVGRLAICAVVGTVASARAQPSVVPAFVTGNRLYEMCLAGLDWCTAYVDAVADAASLPGSAWGVCMPSQISGRQAILAFQKYSNQHPEALNTVAAEVVILGLRETFPCR